MKLVYLVWRDAVNEEASTPFSKAKAELAVLHEVGWLLDETDDAVLIGMELNDTDAVHPGRFRLHIPRHGIVAMHELTDIDTTQPYPPPKTRRKRTKEK